MWKTAAIFKTDSFNPYSLEFSPIFNRLACCANENYGVFGSGRIYIWDFGSPNQWRLSWPNGIYDISWSKDRDSHLFASTVDGHVILYDINKQQPVLAKKKHEVEIYHLEYGGSKSGSPSVLTASWDKTLSLIDCQLPYLPTVNRFYGHSKIVYCCVFSPRSNAIFLSSSGDGTMRVWDAKSPMASIMTIAAHEAEILSCDWCKLEDNLMASAATDGLSKIWDLRKTNMPIKTLVGHEYAIRCIEWSPFIRWQLLTASYDKTTRLWDLTSDAGIILNHHSEFAYGLDFSSMIPEQIADCSWDHSVTVYCLEKNTL